MSGILSPIITVDARKRPDVGELFGDFASDFQHLTVSSVDQEQPTVRFQVSEGPSAKSGIRRRPLVPQGGSVKTRSSDPSGLQFSKVTTLNLDVWLGALPPGRISSSSRSLRLRSLCKTLMLAGRCGASSPSRSRRDSCPPPFGRRTAKTEGLAAAGYCLPLDGGSARIGEFLR